MRRCTEVLALSRGVFLCFGLLALIWGQPTFAQVEDDGLAAFRAGDIQGAYEIWIVRAGAGDVTAQYSLGKLFEKGKGPIEEDQIMAAHWFRAAAAQGLPQALNDLALMYSEGRGVPEDPQRATDLWRAAATQDYSWAQYNLGLALFRGQGVPEDHEEALRWFRKAADSGFANAQFIMGQLSRHGVATEASEEEALHWYLLAAKQGHPEAEKQASALAEAGIKPALPTVASIRSEPEAEAPATTGPDEAAETDVAALPPAGGHVLGGTPLLPPASEDSASVAETSAVDTDLPTVLPAVPGRKPNRPAGLQVASANGEVEAADTQVAKAVVALEPDASGAASVAGDQMKAPEAFYLWLASATSQEEARDLWAGLKARHSGILGQSEVTLAKREIDAETALFRVLAGPLADRTQAEAACQSLRSGEPGLFCKVQAP